MRPSGYLTRPDYRVDILPRAGRVRVRAGGDLIADSAAALTVDEQDHAPVVYVPRDAVSFDQLVPMPARVTHCPYKGDARHWAHAQAPDTAVAWSYEDPYAEVAAIKDYVAFYADRVTFDSDG